VYVIDLHWYYCTSLFCINLSQVDVQYVQSICEYSVCVSSHYVSLTASVFFNGAGTIVQVYFWAVGPVGLLTAQAHPKTAWGAFREDQGHRHRPERDRPMKTPKWPVKVRDQEIYTQLVLSEYDCQLRESFKLSAQRQGWTFIPVWTT